MSFYIVLILWLCFLMCHGYKWNLEINTVWIWNAVSEFVLVKENLYFWMFIFYKCQKTTMKLVICLYLASCHKAWPEFSEVWPQLQEFVSKCYPAAAELKMREISFLLRPQLHLVFFLAGGHSINEAFVLCYCWSCSLQNYFDPICWVIETTTTSFIV